MGYQLAQGGVIDLSDGAFIPLPSTGWRAQAYAAWLAVPNTPLAAAAVAVAPNIQGFVDAVKTAMGGIVGVNTLTRQYPSFYPAIQASQWDDAKALLVDAKSTGFITSDQYIAFQSAFNLNNIPITLP